MEKKILLRRSPAFGGGEISFEKGKGVFSFGVAGVLASAWGFLRAYDLVSSHRARGACDIICFGNRF
jgi:hypothetical protein